MNKIKYRAVKICPRVSKGISTGRPPIHVRRRTFATIVQKIIWARGLKAILRWVRGIRGRINRIRIAENIATTPPSLLGMDRRIA